MGSVGVSSVTGSLAGLPYVAHVLENTSCKSLSMPWLVKRPRHTHYTAWQEALCKAHSMHTLGCPLLAVASG